MAETINNKPKLQLRSGSSFNAADKTPSPVPGLKINHGKPNYTLPRVGAKISDGDAVAANGTNSNNNYNPYRTANSTVVSSTKFNGAFKPSTLPLNGSKNSSEDELGHVTLRRTKIAEQPPIKEAADADDDNVPEFIRRQRRIQERLAKEKVLDFENRRSGYFTHCVISPTATSTDRTSFVPTMSSPAVVPSLEIPPPKSPTKHEETIVEGEVTNSVSVTNGHEVHEEKHEVHEQHEEHAQHAQHIEEKEVNDAIEEMNRAVAGEEEPETPDVGTTAFTSAPFEETEVHEHVAVQHTVELHKASAPEPEIVHATAVVTSLELTEETEQHNGHVHNGHEQNGHEQNGHEHNGHEHNRHVENGHTQNGHTEHGHADVTIPHTNGTPTVAAASSAGPCIPAPDPSGILGVNYEPKTVVSFSHELGSDVNKYPDTVKVLKEDTSSTSVVDEKLKELSKLKFEIIAGDKHDDLEITPVIKTE